MSNSEISTLAHFPWFILVTLVVYVYLLKFVLRQRPVMPPMLRVYVVTFVVVVIGMLFAKFTTNAGLPWSIYYGVPATLTLFVPPIVFRMKHDETGIYLLLTFFVSPLIHILFSFFLGWKEYIPFIHIPSLWELLVL